MKKRQREDKDSRVNTSLTFSSHLKIFILIVGKSKIETKLHKDL